MSKPDFDPAHREVWYTDAASGFWVVRMDASAWPQSAPAAKPHRHRKRHNRRHRHHRRHHKRKHGHHGR